MVDHVRAEQRVVHLVAVDLLHDADAAAVRVGEHGDAVADRERVRLGVFRVPVLPLLDQPRQALLAVAVVGLSTAGVISCPTFASCSGWK